MTDLYYLTINLMETPHKPDGEAAPDFEAVEAHLVEPRDKVREAQERLESAEQKRDAYLLANFREEFDGQHRELEGSQHPAKAAIEALLRDLLQESHGRAFRGGGDGYDVLSEATPGQHVEILRLEIEVERVEAEVIRLSREARLQRLQYYLKVEEGRLQQDERAANEEFEKSEALGQVDQELDALQ